MKSKKIIYFDGVCNLCNWAVRFILKRDKKSVFLFASLQSNCAIKYLNIPDGESAEFDSIVFQKGNQVFFKSDAVIHILRDMGGVWKFFYVFNLLPKSWRNGMYDVVARKRYLWFGKQNTCMVPTPEVEERFLD